MAQLRVLGLVCFNTNDEVSNDEPYINLQADGGNIVKKWWNAEDGSVDDGDTVPIKNGGFQFTNTVKIYLYDDESPLADQLLGQPHVVSSGLANQGVQVTNFVNNWCHYSLLYEVL